MSIFGTPQSDYQGAPRRGINLRWIIALVIAGIGIVTYFTHTQVNPVTGEKQHIAMTVDQEKSLGLEAAPKMASEMGGYVPDSDPRTQLVMEVGKRVVAQSDAGSSKSPYAGSFQFHLLNDSNTINAFALPGGQVFITLALLEKLQNEAQLAGVLGHEIGHVIGRHAAEHMATGQLGQTIAVAVGVGASGDRKGAMAAAAAQMANQMLQLKFSRGDESEADSFGVKFMAQAGYDPSQMLGVMKVLMEASKGGGGRAQIFQTHPDPEKRYQDIEAILKEQYPSGVPATLTKGRSLDPSRDTW